MKIAIGNDHAAVGLKQSVLAYLREKGIDVTNFGTDDEASVHYPDYALRVAKAVLGEYDFGILLCGTGAGMSIAANKVRGIRAVACSEAYTASLSRRHNDANILCLGGRVIDEKRAFEIVDAFLDAEFEGGRHSHRVALISAMEQSQDALM